MSVFLRNAMMALVMADVPGKPDRLFNVSDFLVIFLSFSFLSEYCLQDTVEV